MPKFLRMMDPLVGESASKTKCSNSSNSSSPLIPPLSIQMSPEQTEELHEIAPIHLPSNPVFPLSSPLGRSPSSLLNSTFDTSNLQKPISTRKRKASADRCVRLDSMLDAEDAGTDLMLEKSRTDSGDEEFSNIRLNVSTSPEKANCSMIVTDKNTPREVGDIVNEDSNGTGQTKADDKSTDDEQGSFEVKLEDSSRSEADRNLDDSACALAGLVALTSGSAQSPLQGLVPSAALPRQAASPCFPGSDGNWYQIVSATVPPLIASARVPVETPGGATSANVDSLCSTTTTTSRASSATTTPCVASQGVTTSTVFSTATVASAGQPVSTLDPLLSFLQQYTSGVEGSTEVTGALPTLHLPLNLAATAASPRYLYATNPRTGQLLLLSSVAGIGGAQVVQQQMVPIQQQVKPQEETVWKTPLGTSQQQNSSCSLPDDVLAKHTVKTGSLISKLLQTKPASLSQKGGADENMPPVAVAHELLALASPGRAQPTEHSVAPLPLFTSPAVASEEPIRENHNMKERRRRARIKDACDLMRQLVPGMSEKTDKATVFEFSARYIHFLKNFVGPHHDKDFLIKYSPY